jgi:hypothetical protein
MSDPQALCLCSPIKIRAGLVARPLVNRASSLTRKAERAEQFSPAAAVSHRASASDRMEWLGESDVIGKAGISLAGPPHAGSASCSTRPASRGGMGGASGVDRRERSTI